jgi:farnesyl-diphosphate farnesyltransferase
LLQQLLVGVSRTFALTIPQLPSPLARVVGNAYLLCRIEDTIEDEPALDAAEKHDFCHRLAALIAPASTLADDLDTARTLATDLVPRLSASTLPEERQLVGELPRVITQLRQFTPTEQQAIARCVVCMGKGMAEFQQHASTRGLADLASLDRYCYHVAGVVGEMLTTLFCEHVPALRDRHAALMDLAVSFGQGLQMTNILKDVWEDLARGACWLPRSVFDAAGFDLDRLGTSSAVNDASRQGAFTHLVGVAHAHLRRALEYTLLIPREEAGIRNFCLWAVLMALLTLKRITSSPEYRSGNDVKISRRSVRAVVVASRLCAQHDRLTRHLFGFAARGLPLTSLGAEALAP